VARLGRSAADLKQITLSGIVMKPTFSITIPEPCTQRREDMMPVKGGMHCTACAQTVTDFTLMSDGEILAFIKKTAGGHFCGSFRASQLNRALIPAPRLPWRMIFSQRMAACLFLAQLTFTQAVAQTKKQPVKTMHAPQQAKTVPRIIQGQVLDYATLQPVAGVRIKVLDTTLITNKNGRFQLRLPAGALAGDIVHIEAALPDGDKSRAIFSEQVMLNGKQVQQVVMYRYPQEQLEAATLTATRKYFPVTTAVGGLPIIYESAPAQAKPSLWQHITKPFRKMKHSGQ
jgi:hypothetical protein